MAAETPAHVVFDDPSELLTKTLPGHLDAPLGGQVHAQQQHVRPVPPHQVQRFNVALRLADGRHARDPLQQVPEAEPDDRMPVRYDETQELHGRGRRREVP